GSPALLVLASGYLFAGLIVVVQTLTFPGAFAPLGLLGASEQTAAWLYLFWHFGFAVAALGYPLLKEREPAPEPRSTRPVATAWRSAAGVVAVAVLLTWTVTAGHDWWPRLVVTPTDFAPLSSVLSAVNFALSVLALVVVVARRSSVLDRWLIVALCASV